MLGDNRYAPNISFAQAGRQNMSSAFVILTELLYFGLADIKLKQPKRYPANPATEYKCPSCAKPFPLRVIIFRLSVLQGAYSVFLNFALTKFCNLFIQSAREFCIFLVPGGAFAVKALFG